jgi:hypothetical protein
MPEDDAATAVALSAIARLDETKNVLIAWAHAGQAPSLALADDMAKEIGSFIAISRQQLHPKD